MIEKIHNYIRYYRAYIKSNISFAFFALAKFAIKNLRIRKTKDQDGRALLIDLSLIGDNVMAFPLVDNLLCNKDKISYVDVLCFNIGKEIFKNCKNVNKILILRRKTKIKNKVLYQLVRPLLKLLYCLYIIKFAYSNLINRYNVVVVPKWHEDGEMSAELAFLTDAKFRIGFSENVYQEKSIDNMGRDRFFSNTFLCKAECHESDKFLNLLEQAGFKIYNTNIVLSYKKIQNYKGISLEQPYAVLAMDTTSEDKEWAVENFAEVAKWLNAKGLMPILLGTKVEYAEQFKKLMGDISFISLVGKTSISDTFDIIGNSSMYIGGDTGLSHIAGAVGARGIVLFSTYKNTPPMHYARLCE